MKNTNDYNSRKMNNIVVFTKYNLISSYLKVLLETRNASINISGFAGSSDELFKLISNKKPDVILICLLEDELDNVEVIPKLLENADDSKVLILMSPNDNLDPTNLLKLGVAGIVGAEQKEEMLIRAIKQVAEGGVWLNQKIIAQLLGSGNHSGSNHSKDKGLFENDALTARETEVIKEIGKGFPNKEISKKLFISEATVRHHLSSIYGKLQVEDRLNLVIYAFRNGIINLSDKD